MRVVQVRCGSATSAASRSRTSGLLSPAPAASAASRNASFINRPGGIPRSRNCRAFMGNPFLIDNGEWTIDN
jgi:hypothetical protein